MRSLLVLLAALVIASCASSGQGGSSRNRDVITMDEMANVQVSNAFELIQRLRPEFLRSRGSQSMRSPQGLTPVVYVDGVRQGDTSMLQRLPKESIQEIRYLNGRDATTQYGTDHGGGALLVRTRS
jgi:hypothetical protein